MLDIRKVESDNSVNVVGILNELDINEGKTADGRDYVRGRAIIRVDQAINGQVTENTVPISMFAMKFKKDGSINPMFDRIKKYKENFVSAAAVDDITEASRVSVGSSSRTTGKGFAYVEENTFVSRDGKVVSNFQITSNFLNKARESETDKATFEMTGVIGKLTPEKDKNGDETNRLIIKFITIGYNGRADVIDLIAEDVPGSEAKTFIENHLERGDTIRVTGVIKMTYKTETFEEEQGFGEPILRTKTTSSRELIVKGCSSEGFEASLSYDEDSVKVVLAEREERIEKIKNKAQNNAPAKKKDAGFGF